MSEINEQTQVYLDGRIDTGKEFGKNNLRDVTIALNSSGRSKAQVYAILRGMGVPEDRSRFAVNNYLYQKMEPPLHSVDITGERYKNNLYEMKDNTFTHESFDEALKSLKKEIKEINPDDPKIDYSNKKVIEIVDKYISNMDVINKNLSDDKIEESAKSRVDRMNYTTKSQFHFLGNIINELKDFNWITSVASFIKEQNETIQANVASFLLTELAYDLNKTRQSGFYTNVLDDLEFLLKNDEAYLRENYSEVLSRHKWVKSLNAVLEYLSDIDKVQIANNDGTLVKKYSPIEEGEDGTKYFALSGKYYGVKENEISELTDTSHLSGRFFNLEKIIEHFKIHANSFIMYNHKSKLEIDTNTNEIKVNEHIIDASNYSKFKNSLVTAKFINLNEAWIIDQIYQLVESIDTIKHLDFVTSIQSLVNEGVEVNIMKLDENIYLNSINTSMNKNSFEKIDTAEELQTKVNETINIDVSNFAYDKLEEEQQATIDLAKEKDKFISRIAFLEEKATEVKNTLALIGEDDSLDRALAVLNEELRKSEIELQKVYSKLGGVTESRKLLDKGFVEAIVTTKDGKFKKGSEIWVNSIQYLNSDVEQIEAVDEKGKSLGTIDKDNVTIND